MAEAVLEISRLSKVYGDNRPGAVRTQALRDVSLTVPRGEFMLIVGSSGSGKSTLLNMIGLLDRPTTGSIRIDGVETAGLPDGELSSFRSSRLGFVFQFSNLLAELTVIENVELPQKILGGARRLPNPRELLAAVGMTDQMHKRANAISGGQAQRAAIARGLANGPSIVLADEPTGNLDSKSAAATIELMKSMARELAQTFIIVTHDRHQFGDVDRIVSIKDGMAHEGEHL